MSWGKLPLAVRVACVVTAFVCTMWVALPVGLWWLGRHLGLPALVPPPYRLLGLLLMGAGAAGCAACVGWFHAVGKGTPAPPDPPTRLVVTGPYAYCRNPMFASQFVMMAGEALVLRSVLLAGLVVVGFAVAHALHKRLEEPVLVARFGADYEEYRRHVPMWLPRLTPYRPAEKDPGAG